VKTVGAYYFDSSGLAKSYVKETGSAWVEDVTDLAAGNEVIISLATGAEVAAAICKRARAGTLAPADASIALATFKAEFKSHYFTVNLSNAIIDRAMSLAEKHGLRGYDSIQLATAVGLHEKRLLTGASPLTFVSADDKLNTAAQAEGLLVENPNNYP
jgi:hypothetical protein